MRRCAGIAVVLLLSLALVSASALADGGLLVDQPLSGGEANDPRIVLAPNGYAAAAWGETLVGGQFAVSVATRAPGGTWSAPQQLGASGDQKFDVTVAVDGAGDLAVAWEEIVSPNAHVLVASRAAGGTFAGPELLTDATSVSQPAVGIDASGRVTLMFVPYPGVAVRDFQAGGSALAVTAHPLSSGPACSGGRIAVAPSGDAVAGYGCGGATFALRQAGTWSVTPPATADTGGFCSGTQTHAAGVAIDGQDHPVGLLETLTNHPNMADPGCMFVDPSRTTTEQLMLPEGGALVAQPGAVASGTTPSALISGLPISGAQVGIAPSGIVVAWGAYDGTTSTGRFRFLSADGFPTGSAQTFEAEPSGTFLAEPHLAVGNDGRALLAWYRVPGGSPTSLPVEAATRPPGGTFGAPFEVTTTAGNFSGYTAAALDDGGDGAIAYIDSATPHLAHVRGFDAGKPVLSGVAIPAHAIRGTAVQLAASASDVWGPVSLSWSFGDGGSASGGAPLHAFAAGGTFMVTVTATDAVGNSSTQSGRVDVPVPVPRGPAISQLSLTHPSFRVGSRPTAKSAKARRHPAPVGTTFRFTLDEAATVAISIERTASGRRSGTRCAKPSKRLRRHKRCTRYVHAGTLTRSAQVGADAVPFSGRIGRKALKPGSYRATLTAKAGDAVGMPRQVRFRIVR